MEDVPDYLEREDEVGIGANSVAWRVTRATAETVLGRPLVNRQDFVDWMDEHHDELRQVAFMKCVAKPFYRPGEDRTMEALPEDLDFKSDSA